MAASKTNRGAVAQLGERIPRTDEARGSNPLCSTISPFSTVPLHCACRMTIKSAHIGLALLLILLSGCATSEYNLGTREEDIIFISTASEVRMGERISRRIEENADLYRDPATGQRVQYIGNRLVEASERKDVVYRFRVLDLPDVNALALPGGFVYVTKGLLEEAESDDELACVLGHEIGHIVARHSVKKLQANVGYAALRLLTAQTEAGRRLGQGADLAFLQIMSGYSQQDELLADRLAARYAQAAGYNPEAMISFLERLQEIKRRAPIKKMVYFRTHPSVPERIGAVRLEIHGQRDYLEYIN